MNREADSRRIKTDNTSMLWLWLFLCLALVVAVRSAVLFSTPLMPKVNGAYYLVQVRSILSKGSLAFDDSPLLFWLEAALAWFLSQFGLGLNNAVIAASKLFDSIAPALALVPLFFLARSFDFEENGKARIIPALSVACFATLSFAPLAMIGDFQKNSLGMTFMTLSIGALYLAMTRGSAQRWAAFIGILVLTSLTHDGAFAATLVLTGATFAAYLIIKGGSVRSRFMGLLVGTGLAAVIGLVWILVVSGRVSTLLELTHLVTGLIQPPTMLLNGGKALFTGMEVGIVIFSNIIAIVSLLLWRRSSRYAAPTKALLAGAIVTSFLLASPFINQEWATRFYLMSYLSVAICIGFLLSLVSKGWLSGIAIFLVLVVSVASGMSVLSVVRVPSIPESSYEELYSLSYKIKDPGRTLVIARHGLEWWAAWVLHTAVSEEYNVSPDAWERYESVYFLQQISGSKTGPAGPSGPPFPEARIPDDAKTVAEGHYFRLSTSEKAPDFYPMIRPKHP